MPSCGEALSRCWSGAGVRRCSGSPASTRSSSTAGSARSACATWRRGTSRAPAFMADGWARVTGRPGVCVLIGGPGLTNAMTPIAQAYHDSIPLLVVSGAVPRRRARSRRDPRPPRPARADGRPSPPSATRSPIPRELPRGDRPGVRGVQLAATAPGPHRTAGRRARAAGATSTAGRRRRRRRRSQIRSDLARAASLLGRRTAPADPARRRCRVTPAREAIALARSLAAPVGLDDQRAAAPCPTRIRCASARR